MGYVQRTVHVPLGCDTERALVLSYQPRADRKDPAAWGCCRRLSEMCDRPIVAAPMASPASVTIDGGARLSLWTTGHEGACRGRVEGT